MGHSFDSDELSHPGQNLVLDSCVGIESFRGCSRSVFGGRNGISRKTAVCVEYFMQQCSRCRF